MKELAPEAMGPVCAPSVFAASGGTGLPALHTRSRPDAWSRRRDRVRTEFSFASDVAYEHFYLAIEAALAGQGVALTSIHMVSADIASGRPQELTAFEPDGTRYVALSRRSFNEDPHLPAFVDWLASRMRGAFGDGVVPQ